MQTSKWGNPGWRFLHCLPLCCADNPSEQERRVLLEFVALLREMLPCKYCRASYSDFIKADPLAAHLDNPRFGGHCQLAVAHWLYELHNKVNKKLDKEKCIDFYGKCCKLDNNVLDWERGFWDFILAIVWNYKNEQWRKAAYERFFTLLPRVLQRCQLGKSLGSCLATNQLLPQHLGSTDALKHWAWTLWQACHSGKSMSFPTFSAMDQRYESWRSTTCSTPAPSNASGHQTC
jgi:hypothetical protein